MSLGTHTRTRARIVRAGHDTTLVSLPEFYGGQILCPVDTLTIRHATGLHRHDLPDTVLWVLARLHATTAEALDLRDWALITTEPDAGHTKNAPAAEDDGALWAGSLANTVPTTPWAA